MDRRRGEVAASEESALRAEVEWADNELSAQVAVSLTEPGQRDTSKSSEAEGEGRWLFDCWGRSLSFPGERGKIEGQTKISQCFKHIWKQLEIYAVHRLSSFSINHCASKEAAFSSVPAYPQEWSVS